MKKKNFNCTIQELKPFATMARCIAAHYFNCTIQELKRHMGLCAGCYYWLFQLHHTGIKTTQKNTISFTRRNFNCTIQELKPFAIWRSTTEVKFQLHHTGIKTIQDGDWVESRAAFQLHHTGIKTSKPPPCSTWRGRISIAPYRN